MAGKKEPFSDSEVQVSKQSLLSHRSPAHSRNIASSLVIKDGNLFLIMPRSGLVPTAGMHGYGLYRDDCCWLDGYSLRIQGKRPNTLVATDAESRSSLIEMTNVEVNGAASRLEKESLGLTSHRTVSAEKSCFRDAILLRNYAAQPIEFALSFGFRTSFLDVFEVRGLYPVRDRRVRSEWEDDRTLAFENQGEDGVLRRLQIRFSRPPLRHKGRFAQFRFRLAPRESSELEILIELGESGKPRAGSLALPREKRAGRLWLERLARVSTDSLTVNRVLETSFRDLLALRSELKGERYIAAGVPWFATLFGRDSLLTAYELLPFDHHCARDTLRLLAKLQSREYDPFRDAEPGKILHELRVGELARAGRIPHTPYFGSVDSTPLFLLLLARHADWVGNTELFEELAGAVDAALAWIDRSTSPDGFLYYECEVGKPGALVNQGWKDSGDAMVDSSGRLASPPIALVEVQAYVVEAKRGLARLFRRTGDGVRADRLEREANWLEKILNERFWSAGRRMFGLALERGGRLLDVGASNGGHVLWAGAADPRRVAPAVRALMSRELFAGWGIRTLGADERRFSPLGYHLGTIWPHDNALIASGFRRYGFDREALLVFEGLTLAAQYFPEGRLPEVFSGFSREEFPVPVKYPVACNPQAWAAASYPYLFTALLGLEPRAFEHRLEIHRPVLPPFLGEVKIEGLHLGESVLDLRFRRRGDGWVDWEVLRREGRAEVELRAA